MMVLRFQCVTPIVSHQLTRPDDRGVTQIVMKTVPPIVIIYRGLWMRYGRVSKKEGFWD